MNDPEQLIWGGGQDARGEGTTGTCALVQARVASESPRHLEWEVLCSVWGCLRKIALDTPMASLKAARQPGLPILQGQAAKLTAADCYLLCGESGLDAGDDLGRAGAAGESLVREDLLSGTETEYRSRARLGAGLCSMGSPCDPRQVILQNGRLKDDTG